MNLTEQIHADYAKRPQGFRCHDIPGHERAVTRAIARALKVGLIFRVRLAYRHCVYFGSVQDATEFAAMHKLSPERSSRNTRATKMQDKREAVTPPSVQVQRIPGIERVYDKLPDRVIGGFASLGVGRYL